MKLSCFWTKFILCVLAVKLELFWRTVFENTVELPHALKEWSETERGSSHNKAFNFYVRLYFSLQINSVYFECVSVAFLAFICNSVSSAAISFKGCWVFFARLIEIMLPAGMLTWTEGKLSMVCNKLCTIFWKGRMYLLLKTVVICVS